VERAVEAIPHLIDERRHEFTMSLPAQPIWLHADAARLEQIVLNLLTNAAKYTEHGGHIWLSVEQEGNDCVLRVRDTGIGIARELLPRVFVLFTQAERSLARSQGGLGIGLALVQRLVRMHQGRAETHSTLDQDSEFVVTLAVALYSLAAVVGGVPAVKMRSTLRSTSAAAGAGKRSRCPSEIRFSTVPATWSRTLCMFPSIANTHRA